MSAFMLSTDAFQRIANALPWDYSPRREQRLCHVARPLLRGSSECELSDCIVRDWYKANRLAVQGRYQGRHGTDEIPESLPEGFRARCTASQIKPVALLKLLQCLQYQCSEEVAPEFAEWHESIQEEIANAIDALANSIISGMPEYEAAPWG